MIVPVAVPQYPYTKLPAAAIYQEPQEMQAKPFENVKNQIGYCGLWCGNCIVGNGTLKELTKRYEALIKGYGVNEWVPETSIPENS